MIQRPTRSRTALAASLLALALATTGCQAQTGAGTTAPAAEHAAVSLDTPRLASADNFRDLAGLDTAYAAGEGHLRPETVYRSNALELSDEDLAVIEDLGVATVIDLRTASEIEEHPDRVPEGAEYVNFDIMGQGNTAVNPTEGFAVDTPEGAAQMLEAANVAFVEEAAQRAEFAKVLTAITESDGPVVFHCTAGKDRAGWTAATLQLAAGVDETDVVENYLATNDYSADRIAATKEQIREAQGEETAEGYGVLLGVQESFLRAGLDAMEEQYGGIDGYLEDGLGLDDTTVEKLRDKLVV